MECLPVWNHCNNKCLMCSNPPDYAAIGEYSLEALQAAAAKFSKKETDIYLTGGEPSLNPCFFDLLAFLRARFPRARILMDTNGRMFAYPAFAARCVAIGNMEFQVSLCGYDARSHEAVTLTPDSFGQAVAGIKNLLLLKERGAEVEVRFVLTRLSLGGLEKVYKFVRAKLPGIKALVLIFLEMEGHAGRNSKTVGLRYGEAVKPVEALFAGLKNPPFEVKLYHFPLCTLPPRLWKYAWRTLPDKEITFPAQCGLCKVKQYCLGVHKDYLKFYGAEEFKPVLKRPGLKLTSNFCRPIKDLK